jgi:hypothetical protein
LYECDWMIVLYECYKKYKNKQKEWHTATKPLKITRRHQFPMCLSGIIFAAFFSTQKHN